MNKLFTPTKCLNKALLKDYLDDSISDYDRFLVESHLIDCPLCTEAVEGYSQHPSVLKETNTKTFRIGYFPKVAVAICILSLASGYWWFSSPATTQNLIAEQFSDELLYPIHTNLRSAAQPFTQAVDFQEGMNSIIHQEYDKAITSFSKVLVSSPNNTEAHYYLGFSAFQNKDWKKAEKHLKKSITNDYYQAHANWYIVATSLKQNKKDEAITILKTISQDRKSPFQNRAKKLLESL